MRCDRGKLTQGTLRRERREGRAGLEDVKPPGTGIRLRDGVYVTFLIQLFHFTYGDIEAKEVSTFAQFFLRGMEEGFLEKGMIELDHKGRIHFS